MAEEAMSLSRASAVGTWKLAQEYLDATSRLNEDVELFETSMPTYFLFCHAIELALKSFIINQGHTEKALGAIGHNLEDTLSAAPSHDYFSAYLSPKQQDIVRAINPYYHGKELEYLAVGAKSYPVLADVEETAWSVVSGLKPLVRDAVSNQLVHGR